MGIEWIVSCPKCKFLKNFKNVTGVNFREFTLILKRICPNCFSEITVSKTKYNSLIAKCRECNYFTEVRNLKNLKKEYLNNKKEAFFYIVPRCQECGSGCIVFPQLK